MNSSTLFVPPLVIPAPPRGHFRHFASCGIKGAAPVERKPSRRSSRTDALAPPSSSSHLTSLSFLFQTLGPSPLSLLPPSPLAPGLLP